MNDQVIQNWTLLISQKKTDSDILELPFSKMDLVSNRSVAKGLYEKPIYFQYRKSEGDKDVEIYIAGKAIHGRVDRKTNIVKFKWDKINYGDWFAVKLVIYGEGESCPIEYRLKIDVLTKIDDNDSNEYNFHDMVNTLQEIHINPYRLFNPSRISEGKENCRPPIPMEQFVHILENNIIRKLEYVTRQIFLNPCEEYDAEMKYDVIDIVDNDIVGDMLNNKENLIDIGNCHVRQEIRDIFIENGITQVSSRVLLPKTIIIRDIYEHQLLKNLLMRITYCIKEIEYILEEEKKEYKRQRISIKKHDYYGEEYDKLVTKNKQIIIIDRLMTKCYECRKRVENMRTNPFFDDIQDTNDISRCTSLLLKDINYNRFYRIFRNFMRMPKFYFSNDLGLTILDLPTIYEYWSLVYIIKSFNKKLPKGWKPKKIKMIRNFKYGYLVRFPYGKLLEFSNKKLKKKIIVFYHESYRALLSEEITRETNSRSDLVPDIGIDTVIDRKLCCVDVLDPKYRTRLTSGDSNDPENARNKMAAYKMLIVGHTIRPIEEDRYDIIRNSITPYLGKTHIDSVKKIGGMRLYPRGNDTDTEDLDNIVQDIIDNANNMTLEDKKMLISTNVVTYDQVSMQDHTIIPLISAGDVVQSGEQEISPIVEDANDGDNHKS